MSTELKKEFDYYISRQAEFVERYNGKVIVLKNQEVLGVYEDELEAVKDTERVHELGTFLVQRVTDDDRAYTQSFNSRVAFG